MAEPRTYPDCPPLGSDIAELTAFVMHLGLIAGCIRDGHTQKCAERLVWFDAPDCSCGAGPCKTPIRGGRDG